MPRRVTARRRPGAGANAPRLLADRPGKTTPPCILAVGHTQIETGLADAVFQRGHSQHSTVTTLGAIQVRFGLTPTPEAEAAWAPMIIDHEREVSDRTGSGDLTVGLRTALTAPSGEGLQVSLQGFVNAPTATHDLGAGGWTGGVRLPVCAPLGKDPSLGLAPEIDIVCNASGSGAHLLWMSAVSLSHAIGKTILGAKAYGEIDDDPRRRVYQASADLTAARTIGDNAQVDAGANFSLNHATPQVEVYVGVARRF